MSAAAQRIDTRRERRASALATVDSGAAIVPRLRAAHDFYVEPRWAVEALLEVERFPGQSWDPACGGGTIVQAMRARGYACGGTDIEPRGGTTVTADFLVPHPAEGVPFSFVHNIVTNPPFALAEAFIARALSLATAKVAMLLRLSFLEGQARRTLFETTPLARVWVFSRRVSMPPGGSCSPAKGGAVAFAWYVWQHGHRGPPQLGWLP